MSNKITKSSIILILIITAIFIGLRLFLLLDTDTFHGIAAGRTLLAELILRNGFYSKLCFVPVHPPIHTVMLVAGLFIWNNPIILPGLVSLFFGTLTCLPFYYYNKSVFDEKVAVFSLAAISLYSDHIAYSIIGTSETIFHFFLFSSLVFALFFKKNKNMRYFYLSAIMISIASLCRYEGIIFIPFFSVFLTKKIKNIILFLIVSLILPGIWMCVNFYFTGNFIYFLNTNDITVPLQFNWMRLQGLDINVTYKILFWPRVLINTIGVFFLFFGLGGVIFCLKRGEKLFPAGLVIFILCLFVLRTYQEKLYLQTRYGITIGLLLIPFAIYFFQVTVKKINRNLPDWLVLFLLLTLIPAWGKTLSQESLFLPDTVKNISSFLGKEVKENENIFITSEQNENYREVIKLRSRLNPKQFILIPYLEPYENKFIIKLETFFQYLEKENIKFFVYSPEGELGNILKFEGKGEKFNMNGFWFKLIYKNRLYHIYKVDPLKEGVEDV
ncbi:MAG: glycosyltransferase family 39 protein [Candidatus Omnitrophota bacterium]